MVGRRRHSAAALAFGSTTSVVPPAAESVETFPVRVTDGWVEIGLTGSLASERGAA